MKRFEFETLNVTECLNNYQIIISHLKEKRYIDSLYYYLEHYDNFTCRGILEWKIASGIVEIDFLESFPSSFPKGMSRQFSGAALIFVISQMARSEIDLPEVLFSMPVLEPERKLVLARALNKYPNFNCPSGNAGFEGLVNWLCLERGAIAPCLFAAAQRTSIRREYLDELSSLWLQKGLYSHSTLFYLNKAREVPLLKQTACDALTRCLSIHWEDNNALLGLEDAAFRLEQYRAVIAYSDILLSRQLDDEEAQMNMALRIVSLAEEGLIEEAVLEYSRLWSPNDWVFPYPERLLYPLQFAGARKEEEHLLKSITDKDTVPMWIRLNHKRIINGSSKELLEEWSGLYYKDRQDEAVLVGLSLTLIELPDIQRDQKLCHLVLEHWKLLYTHESYKPLAGAFLVMIANSHQDRINAFEQFMQFVPLDTYLSRKAGHYYLMALMARKRWKDLLFFLENVENNQLKSICNYEEYEFVKLMANFEATMPKDKTTINFWCEQWELMISLPLTTHMLYQALELFLILKERLKKSEHNLNNHDLFIDLEYQFLRRVKAEAESILNRPGVPVTEQIKRREQLRDASLEATYNILNQIGL